MEGKVGELFMPALSKKFVPTGPGHTAITLTPDPLSSLWRASLKLSTKDLVAAYDAMNGTGWNAAVLAILIIVPLFFFRNTFTNS